MDTIMPDGTILSGNGRVMSLNEVYTNPALRERARPYQERFGVASEPVR